MSTGCDSERQVSGGGFTQYQRAAASLSAAHHRQAVAAGKAAKGRARSVATFRDSCDVGLRGAVGLKGHRISKERKLRAANGATEQPFSFEATLGAAGALLRDIVSDADKLEAMLKGADGE